MAAAARAAAVLLAAAAMAASRPVTIAVAITETQAFGSLREGFAAEPPVAVMPVQLTVTRVQPEAAAVGRFIGSVVRARAWRHCVYTYTHTRPAAGQTSRPARERVVYLSSSSSSSHCFFFSVVFFLLLLLLVLLLLLLLRLVLSLIFWFRISSRKRKNEAEGSWSGVVVFA